MKIIYEQDLIPNEYKRKKDFETFYFECKAIHGKKVEEGDVLFTGIACDNNCSKIDFDICADRKGYFCQKSSLRGGIKKEKYSCVVAFIYDSMEEWCKNEYSFKYSKYNDSIKKTRIIEMDYYNVVGGHYAESIEDRDCHVYLRCKIKLKTQDKQPVLSLTYEKKDFKLKKGDKLYFCNKNKPYLELETLHIPHDSDDKDFKTVDFLLLEKDVDSLIKNNFYMLTVVYKDGKPQRHIYNEWCRYYGYFCDCRKPLEPSSDTFRRYVSTYKQALLDAGITFENTTKKKDTKIKLDPCYVYLMHDSKNGYHKIGISKTPKYREKTLQSEKPTIDMVCAKEYPSRKIAEAIEAALHKVYDECRIRGEWFNLSEADVAMIRETLK